VSLYAPIEVGCSRCRQPPGQRCHEVLRVDREWWDPDGVPLAAPRIVGLVLGRERRRPHPERVRFARSESDRVKRRRARR
jgi:hypothetical protein